VKPLPDEAERRRPQLIDLWESISEATRIEVERLMQHAGTSTSLSAWLISLADLLVQERPARKLGAPRSQLQLFVWRVAAIWRRLGLRPGLAYNFFLHPGGQDRRGGRIESGFQSYCRAALAAFGDFSEISARQVENAKKKRATRNFATRYISARDFQAEGLCEEMIEIARDTSGDWVEKIGADGKAVMVVDHENIARARRRIKALEGKAARMAPRKYGNRR
jgi:Bacteriophage Sf6, terminase small subunit-like